MRLKVVLRQRHLQTHRAFCREYDKVARRIDGDLVGTYPSRAQFHRWLSGELKGLPYPDHCRVLEEMLPGYTAAELFEPYADEEQTAVGAEEPLDEREFLGVIENRINRTNFGVVEWGPEPCGEGGRADRSVSSALGVGEETQHEHRLRELRKDQRFSDHEISQFASLVGNIIDVDARVDIEIGGDGSAHLTYRYEILNMTDRPLTRVSRELWFEYTDGKLDIRPWRESTRRVAIQRVHDTPNLSKFSCQFSPAIQPNESAIVGYTCDGGKFLDALYWRQTIYNHTRGFAINLRHNDAGDLISCSAIEEQQNGAENSATEDLVWDCENSDVIITLTRKYLRPSQSVTLRWKVTREHS